MESFGEFVKVDLRNNLRYEAPSTSAKEKGAAPIPARKNQNSCKRIHSFNCFNWAAIFADIATVLVQWYRENNINFKLNEWIKSFDSSRFFVNLGSWEISLISTVYTRTSACSRIHMQNFRCWTRRAMNASARIRQAI